MAIDKDAKIYVAGHCGMVGSAIVRCLQQGGYTGFVIRTISEFAETVTDMVGCKVKMVFDSSKPDATPRKLLDVSRLTSLGWKPRTPLREGIARAYDDFLKQTAT